ncbi:MULTISPECIES: hypothetical protein [Streptomyces]|uniref:Uncharacterized protein n=2 Tax=Streptomyces TaxID=1883 RepID=A0A101QEI3_STRCK|nr:hypothetical protein [Streptomyces corchorusii]AEY86935.1 hypothetical protein SHJG_1660 [Streptomyces hygroscopicus subsp. jinggangensis 5008]AGF61090.1 hypothetical protein SHJGH_1424 [Streptomyces hygroscopicus subsp. jinggangensis TL01]ALO91370.1 hypothetical protein SHL15_0159 [Streptomyces hygroscopicus subsp. limoneus]KUN28486.1 hypothetical protein AQJ11_13350 [Streptomyces corchorusii]
MAELRRDASSAPADLPARPAADSDAAGGITLSGRNRACARARVLAGMVLTSGLVITLTSIDTSVSAPH